MTNEETKIDRLETIVSNCVSDVNRAKVAFIEAKAMVKAKKVILRLAKRDLRAAKRELRKARKDPSFIEHCVSLLKTRRGTEEEVVKQIGVLEEKLSMTNLDTPDVIEEFLQDVDNCAKNVLESNDTSVVDRTREMISSFLQAKPKAITNR